MSDVAEDKETQLHPVDLVGISDLLKDLMVKDIITCEERDSITQRIAADNDFPDYKLSILAGYQHSKEQVLERIARKNSTVAQYCKPDESYIFLTELVRAHSDDAPRYIIQTWMRSGNTLVFLNLWEKGNNPDYYKEDYMELLDKKKAASFTLTPKLWIERTKATGIISKQGKSGGTDAHPMIACEFASWLVPEFKMQLLKLSLNRGQLRWDFIDEICYANKKHTLFSCF